MIEGSEGEAATEPGSRIQVTGGGPASAEELAAIVVALTPATGVEADEVGSRPAGSAWREASLLEAVGFRPFVSVDDVDRYHRSLA